MSTASEDSALPGLEMRDRTGLGHSESLPEDHGVGGNLVHELVDESGAKGSSSTGHSDHGFQVGGLDVGAGCQPADQWGHQGQPRGLKKINLSTGVSQQQKDFLKSYLVRGKGFDVHLRLKFWDGDNLGSDLESKGHDGVHGVDVEEGKNSKGCLLQSV